MRTWLLAFLPGVVAVGLLPVLPDWVAMLWTSLLLGTVAWGCGRGGLVGSATFARALAGFCAGVAWHAAYGEDQLAQRLPAALEGRDLPVTGTVVSIPEQRPTSLRFRFQVDSASEWLPGRTILLNAYDGDDYRAGQRWQFTVRLQRPHGMANPGTLDYEAWLFQQGLSARGYIRPGGLRHSLGMSKASLARWRAVIGDRVLAASAAQANQWLFLALTLGERSGISDQHWELFTLTGTNHLVVISGLHVALVAGLCKWLGARLWRLSLHALSYLPAQHAGALAALAGCIFYSLLAGFGLPAQRATVMVGVFIGAQLLGLRCSAFLILLLAAFVVLMINPVAVTGAGFWLSFCAVAGLLLVFAGRQQAPSRPLVRAWRGMLLSQFAVTAALLVPMGIWQGKLSVVAPLANAVAIPLVGWVLVPLCLLGTALAVLWPTPAPHVFELADKVAELLLQGLVWLVRVSGPETGWQLAPGSLLLLVSAALGSLLIVMPGGGRYRLLAALMVLPLLTPIRYRSAAAALELHVLDVGQGLAIVVRTPGHTLVYDAGPHYPGGLDTGQAVVAPVLQRLGVKRVDRLIISHADNDHAGGVAGLLAALPVSDLLVGEPVPDLPDPARSCAKGQSWQWDRVRFRILHPPSNESFEGNNSSCVLEISIDRFRALLPGDVEGGAERVLLTESNGLQPLDVLVSAHHGSNTSSSWSFLARTRPDLVIHSAGYRNQFGHPANAIRDRFQQFGSRQLLTAEQGMISLYYAGADQPLVLRTRRGDYRRYWHWSALPQTGR